VQGAMGLPFAAIQSAKLVMTDRLIAATAPLLAGEADAADDVIEFEGDPDEGAETLKTEED